MDIAAVLQRSKPFCHASKTALIDIARTTIRRDLTRNAILWNAGQVPASFTIIYRGLFKVVRSLKDGRETIVGLFGPRESIGDIAVIQGIPYPATAIVCTESATIIQIPRVELLARMQHDPGLAFSLNQAMGDRVQALHTKVQILSAGGVEARLASLILDLADRFGDEFENDDVIIPIPLSRQDLANLVSTTFETTVRVMSKWKKAGIMDTTSDGFVVRDMAHLRNQASNTILR